MLLFIRALFFALLLPGSVVGLVPWLIRDSWGDWQVGAWRFFGLPLMAVGLVLLVWCIWDFAHQGRGTLFLADAPRSVVRTGPYQVVRNPMYVGVLTTLAGEVLFLRSRDVARWAGVMFVAFNLFVLLYEEPALRRRFGADYEDYVHAVPRWIPRRRR